MLNAIEPLRSIYAALGGDWNTIEADWKSLKTLLEQRTPPLTAEQLRARINTVLDAISSTQIPEKRLDELRAAIKAVSPWEQLKLAGLNALPSGEPRLSAERLIKALRRCGLFVVDCGELERFVPSIGGHGPAWVSSVLERDLAADPELDSARRFVRELVREAGA